MHGELTRSEDCAWGNDPLLSHSRETYSNARVLGHTSFRHGGRGPGARTLLTAQRAASQRLPSRRTGSTDER
jgi:hypothetical protein